MITVGSQDREQAAARFPFLAQHYRGRRKAIRQFTHWSPDFVFWVFPDGKLYDARDSHLRNVPRGFEHILDDEPDYGGFLRGRIASNGGETLIVVYCREEALAFPGETLNQFLTGIRQIRVPVDLESLVISDNGDLYGTLADLQARMETTRESA